MFGFLFNFSFLFLLISANLLHAKYCLDSAKGETKICRIKVMGERCSGTTYTLNLLSHNLNLDPRGLNEMKVGENAKYGIKHFSPWFGYESSYFGPREDYTFEDSDDVLFVLVFRDPYDWLRSIKQYTVLGPQSHQICTFSQFIRMPWGGVNVQGYPDLASIVALHPLIDMNPEDGKPFKNIIKMRSAKIKNFLEIRNRVQNFCVINYEQARDHALEVVEEIATFFDLTCQEQFDPILTIRGRGNTPYTRKEYPKIDLSDLAFINNQLDKELENSIGYQLKDNL